MTGRREAATGSDNRELLGLGNIRQERRVLRTRTSRCFIGLDGKRKKKQKTPQNLDIYNWEWASARGTLSSVMTGLTRSCERASELGVTVGQQLFFFFFPVIVVTPVSCSVTAKKKTKKQHRHICRLLNEPQQRRGCEPRLGNKTGRGR